MAIYFLTVLQAGSSSQRTHMADFQRRLSSWLADGHFLTAATQHMLLSHPCSSQLHMRFRFLPTGPLVRHVPVFMESSLSLNPTGRRRAHCVLTPLSLVAFCTEHSKYSSAAGGARAVSWHVTRLAAGDTPGDKAGWSWTVSC
jgi:hypothetical protein